MRSKLRDAVAGTILCGDAQAHSGNAALAAKWVFWDADRYKIQTHKALLAPAGSVGSLTIYDGDTKELSEFAIQICNEKLLSVHAKPDGRTIHQWQTREPHDILDTVAQAYAAAAQQNLTGSGLMQTATRTISPGKAQLLQRLIRERRRTQFR